MQNACTNFACVLACILDMLLSAFCAVFLHVFYPLNGSPTSPQPTDIINHIWLCAQFSLHFLRSAKSPEVNPAHVALTTQQSTAGAALWTIKAAAVFLSG